MKILVLWAEPHSSNLGVRALERGTAALAEKTWPGVEVSSQGYGPGDAPMRIASPRRLAREALDRKSRLREWVKGFDLAIDARGGDSFADIYGLDRLMAMSTMEEFIAFQRVPYILGPQTIGPFTSKRAQWIGRRSLRRATAVLARDSASASYAKGLGRPVDAVCTDVVFALDVPVAAPRYDVLLNVSGLLWAENPHVDSSAYRALVKDVVEGLRCAGRDVTLMAHVLDSPVPDNDVPALRELVDLVGDIDVVVPTSLEDVRETIAASRLVIASRMHACLNALSVGVPAIPLAYSRKFDALLNDLGWPYTIDLRDGSSQLARVLELASTDLANLVPDVRAEAGERLDLAVKVLRGVA